MGSTRKTPRSRIRKSHDRAVTGDAGSGARVERLRRDFARFRQTHPLRTRIPDSLRRAALSALHSGTTESEVRRACGVTSDQLAQWRKHQQVCVPQRSLEIPEPRFFPVVDSTDGSFHTREPEQQDLELRIDSWAIRVRQLQR